MNTHESISPEDKGYRWIRDLKVWNETKPVIRVKMSRCLPCSNPCDSCFSPAPETPGALPQPETQTCTRVQMWKSIHSVPQYALALHCSVCWHGALIFFFFPSIYSKLPHYSDSPFVPQHYSVAEVRTSLSSDGVSPVVCSSLFTCPYQVSKKCTFTDDFNVGSNVKLSFRARATFYWSYREQGVLANLYYLVRQHELFFPHVYILIE